MKVSIRKLEVPVEPNPLQGPPLPSELRALVGALIQEVQADPDWVRGKTVFLKPNLNFVPGAPNPLVMTDPRLILAVAAVLHERGAARILLGEKPGQRRTSAQAYQWLSANFALPAYLECLELDQAPRVSASVRTRLVCQQLEVPRAYLEADRVVDLPKLKTHTLTQVSLGMKNLFGLLQDEEKLKHHNEDLHPKLVDLLSVRAPDLTLIDGLCGLEGQGPLFGSPRPLNLLLASADCVAADGVAAHLMGFEPLEIDHLRLALEHGLGEPRPERLERVGLSLEQARSPFLRPQLWANPVPAVQVVRGTDVPAGYANALSHSLERLAAEALAPPSTYVYLGRFPRQEVPPGTVIFGDLTAGCLVSTGARVIRGHPPRAFELYELLAG